MICHSEHAVRGISIIFKNIFVFSEKIPIFALELESKLKEHRKTEKWDGDSQNSELILLFNN